MIQMQTRLESADNTGVAKFKRLDFCKGEIRDKVLRAVTLEELNNIFDADGFVG